MVALHFCNLGNLAFIGICNMFIELCKLGIEIYFLSSVATVGKDGHGFKA